MPLLAGCVLPLSPEFQDPPAQQNLPPIIVSTSPPQGSIMSISSGPAGQEFTVTVTDPNAGDTLHVRWLIDYPPYSNNSGTLGGDATLAPPTADQLRMAPTSITCTVVGLTRDFHALTALIADRDFTNDATAPREVRLTASDGLKAQANWVADLSNCPPPQ